MSGIIIFSKINQLTMQLPVKYEDDAFEYMPSDQSSLAGEPPQPQSQPEAVQERGTPNKNPTRGPTQQSLVYSTCKGVRYVMYAASYETEQQHVHSPNFNVRA